MKKYNCDSRCVMHGKPCPARQGDECDDLEKVLIGEGGGLFCRECGESVLNTANYEMRKEGYYSYSHTCKTEVTT